MADAEKQKRLIEYLVQALAKCRREQLVHEELLEEQKHSGIVGIPDALDRLRRSAEIQTAFDYYMRSLRAMVLAANEELPDHVLQELILRLELKKEEPN